MKILSLSGFIPEQICDTIRFEGYRGDTSISHYCQYCADYISQVISDNSIDGAVFPKSCDSTRNIKSYLQETKKFIYQLPVPARQDEFALDYFAHEIEEYKNALENYFDFKIENIKERIEKINKRNESIKSLYNNLENISYKKYLKNIHENLKKPLFEQNIPTLQAFDSKGGGHKRIYLIGSFLASDEIIDSLEDTGFKIVGDNLPESGRLASIAPCALDNDIYKNISKSILLNRLSPTQNNFEKIIARDIKEIKEKEVQGVIFVTQKYCEAYDFLYRVYEKRLQAEGIKSLKISLSNSDSPKKQQLALEAFSDMV